MKKNKLMKGLVALSVLGLISAGALAASTTLAASNQSTSKINRPEWAKGQGMKRGNALTEAQKQELETKQAAVKTALEAGNYDNWVTAVKAVNANAPILAKINSTNFNRYVEAYKLRVQADAVMKELGLNQGKDSFGFGNPGAGLGLGNMMGKGCGLGLKTQN